MSEMERNRRERVQFESVPRMGSFNTFKLQISEVIATKGIDKLGVPKRTSDRLGFIGLYDPKFIGRTELAHSILRVVVPNPIESIGIIEAIPD